MPCSNLPAKTLQIPKNYPISALSRSRKHSRTMPSGGSKPPSEALKPPPTEAPLRPTFGLLGSSKRLHFQSYVALPFRDMTLIGQGFRPLHASPRVHSDVY